MCTCPAAGSTAGAVEMRRLRVWDHGCMGDQSIRVLVGCRIEPEDLQDALDVYRELISKTRREVGCISYELLQMRESPHEFVLAEEWASQEHLDAHTRTEHFVLAMAKLETLETARPALIYQLLL